MKHPEETDPVPRPQDALQLWSRRIRVEVAQGPDAGQVAELPGLAVRIGSSPDCDFVLTDSTVSRLHLHLRVERDTLRVLDAGSRNGTRIDGIEVRDAYARPDSLIVLGATTLRLRMLTDVVELPLSPRERFGPLVGRSIAMRRVFSVLERAAPTDATVLVEGETGTGKELVAVGLHEASPRASGPFVVFDCSAAAPTLIESALFGHVRGAFTGATGERPGVFEEAHGGTLFLDEIGELPLELQPKLLRVLEARGAPPGLQQRPARRRAHRRGHQPLPWEAQPPSTPSPGALGASASRRPTSASTSSRPCGRRAATSRAPPRWRGWDASSCSRR